MMDIIKRKFFKSYNGWKVIYRKPARQAEGADGDRDLLLGYKQPECGKVGSRRKFICGMRVVLMERYQEVCCHCTMKDQLFCLC